MAPLLERLCYTVLALIHIVPASMLFRPRAIGQLYRIDANGPLLALLQHRAALFAIVVLVCIWAIIEPASKKLAVAVIATSMVSFLAIYWNAGSPSALRNIALADLAGLPFLGFAAWAAFAR